MTSDSDRAEITIWNENIITLLEGKMLTTPAQRAAARRWRENHPERLMETMKRQYAARMADPVKREKSREANRRYYAAHPEVHRAAHKRWRSHPNNTMADRLRSRLRQAYQHGLTSSIEELLGCSLKEFRDHIERLFKPGMSRLNHGAIWQFDHIIPCSKFDLTDPAQQKQCFHFSNIQPLFKRDNQLKHNRAEAYPEFQHNAPLAQESSPAAGRLQRTGPLALEPCNNNRHRAESCTPGTASLTAS